MEWQQGEVHFDRFCQNRVGDSAADEDEPDRADDRVGYHYIVRLVNAEEHFQMEMGVRINVLADKISSCHQGCSDKECPQALLSEKVV